ncbi:hypothetical protein PGAG_00307 [Phaeocystis globosa virus 12T]|uniref:Uncharacterized protein n=1 Tax=Phaeocystis globosa virus PgV-16T TaxID=3071227 RepID=A0AC59EXG8_9VIRU|nr:hypothetical protein PGCG_00346 [Phaeocystis globosa virus]AET73196.1 hypothetical protein PGAG_00307 [Phaeocystis globosa virus 12T]AET74020.1 hypothetical protein PGBG_00312 [Phaeocystis globosa virus 14T]AGM15657.1 hypothetical protein PGCG_00346 [Phaeocystis globosa virus PgV-16T]UYE94387.1 hypothetical protein PGV14T_00346 [Phaeocystis globosa virus]
MYIPTPIPQLRHLFSLGMLAMVLPITNNGQYPLPWITNSWRITLCPGVTLPKPPDTDPFCYLHIEREDE